MLACVSVAGLLEVVYSSQSVYSVLKNPQEVTYIRKDDESIACRLVRLALFSVANLVMMAFSSTLERNGNGERAC